MTTITYKQSYFIRIKTTPRTVELGVAGCEYRRGMALVPTAGYQAYIEKPVDVTDDEIETIEIGKE
jgi:hypothetical protein